MLFLCIALGIFNSLIRSRSLAPNVTKPSSILIAECKRVTMTALLLGSGQGPSLVVLLTKMCPTPANEASSSRHLPD